MQATSPLFQPLDLASIFNRNRTDLPESLRTPEDLGPLTGSRSFHGIPFLLGPADGPNVIYLDQEPITLDLQAADEPIRWIVFLHAVEDRITNYLDGFADTAMDGNELGDHVSDYALVYSDGTVASTAIRRRFAIQQSHTRWGASPFQAIPAKEPSVFPTATEEIVLGRTPQNQYGWGETRHASGRDATRDKLWLFALENPHPDKQLHQLVCTPQTERSVIYGISLGQVETHPLRPGVRRKLRLTLPAHIGLNRLGECEELAIDLGQVISARVALDYDHARWLAQEPNVQPEPSAREVIVEYAAHPQARLYVGADPASQQVIDLAALPSQTAVEVAPARRPVTVRVVEKGSNRLAPVRIHFHGAHGEYLPPRGRHRKVNPFWFEDNYGEFVNGRNQYAYIDGHCEVDLPLGDVYVEITRGYETAPVRTQVQVTPETHELTFELERVLHWREQGWVTADTHVHFLSPTTALLEGKAEDVHVVNLLASQWGEMYSNVSDFDGRTTLGAREFGGDGEFLVRVGTENRMQVLGHISLLGYQGPMIHPLCTGGPSESALGDPQEVVMAEWARRCMEQGGLVVMPHAPNPQLERAADIVLGVVHAIEMMTFNPHDAQINPYGLADWYRYLNLGYQLPLVGGSDKMSAASLLGGVRTYAHLGDQPFTYENWMAAVQAGDTFVTVGPLARLTVAGVHPGGQVVLPAGGGSVDVSWKVESVRLPIERVEIVAGGLTLEQVNVGGELAAQGSATVPITASTWVALRVRGSYRGEHGEIAAHTSAVQVLVEGSPLFHAPDAAAVLDQIEGAIAYVDTIAPRPEAQRFKQMRATLEAAYNRLHQRMHAQGVFHNHPHHNHE